MKLKNIGNRAMSYRDFCKFYYRGKILNKKLSSYNYFSAWVTIIFFYDINDMKVLYKEYLTFLSFDNFDNFFLKREILKEQDEENFLLNSFYLINNFSLLQDKKSLNFNHVFSQISNKNNLVLDFLKNKFNQNFNFFFQRILSILYSM